MSTTLGFAAVGGNSVEQGPLRAKDAEMDIAPGLVRTRKHARETVEEEAALPLAN